MQFFILPAIIFSFIVAFSTLGQFLDVGWEEILSPSPQTQEDVSPQKIDYTKKSTGLAAVAPTVSEPVILIDTYITSGPEEGEIIEDTNKITFEFEGEILLGETEKRISFETKCEGFDKDWVSTYSKKRTLKLPPGPKEYKFLVRAKINNVVDLTPASRTFKINTSPYFGKVEIYGVKSQTSSHPSLITLSTNLNEDEKVNITNWYIEGNGGKVSIPQATEKYPPSSYGLVPTGNIFIRKGDRVYLLSGTNPLGGSQNGFRLNICFGYFLNYQKFYPSFSKSCPKPKLEEISHLSQYCQEFIRDLSRCEIPDYSQNFKVAYSSECKSYINDHFNYSGCFKYYSQDENFLKSYWYVYLKSDIASRLHDTLYLYDQDGLIVDKYLY